ncbi:MAG: PAS domain-containing sensor histidine kinase [Deltaproteobacteria bacterium]|nr:MAG: PAS domain-containing sensor histidine kinase [Deltaproteobacteria bacterium]
MLPLFPVYLVDLIGSASMIVISFLCVMLVRTKKREDPTNVIWTYLLWLSLALFAFAISRSVGHIIKHILIVTGKKSIWLQLRPFSGAMNTIMFVLVASITLFFQRVQNIYFQIVKDKQKIQRFSEKLMWLNRHLEDLVSARTAELQASETKYRRIFEGSNDMLFVADNSGTFFDVNKSGLDLLGYQDKAEIIKKINLKDIFANGEDFQYIFSELHEKGIIRDHETAVISKDGSTKTVLFSCTIQPGQEDDPETLQGVIKDITHRKEIEKHMLRADKLASLGKLSAGLAHEINNPLGMILGYTQLLLRYEKPETQRYSDLKIIEKHVRNCKAIVEDLLNFARSTETKKIESNINELLRDVLKVMEHQFEMNGIEIVADLNEELPNMTIDPEKIKQVFMNILMNAKDAIQGRGKITIKSDLNSRDNTVVITFSDTGCGIRSEDLPHIFDPFFTTKPTGKGTGLGLSVSYGIIQDHGGNIEVESKVDEGTTFIVTLPAKDNRPKGE